MLNFIIGTAGSGKSYNLQYKLIDESIKNPDSRFVLLVPDQYSLEAQKEILDKHKSHGTFNIEVSSFNRLAYEILDGQGNGQAQIMDELTKSILIRKALIDCSKDLKVYSKKVNMPGFTEKVKSILDEFGQYNIDDEQLKDIIKKCEDNVPLKRKLEDVEIIRNAFNKYVDNANLTREELLHKFIDVVGDSDTIKNTYIYLDGFTGFTPIQEKVIAKLVEHAKDVTVTVTMEPDDYEQIVKLAQDKGLRPEDRKIKKEELLPSEELFSLGKNTVYHLASEIPNVSKLDHDGKENKRIENNEALTHISNNIFRNKPEVFNKKQDSIEIHEAISLEDEVLSVVKRIATMVRTKEYRYSDFAVITGDLETYYKYIDKLFKKYEIPVFIDNKKAAKVNLFVDLIIALIRLAEYNFDYNRLFHVLRLGVTDIDQDDIDYIENYIVTLRRTSFRSFAQEWKKNPDKNEFDINRINEIRSNIYDYFKDFMTQMQGKNSTVSDYCRAIFMFFEKINVFEKINKYVDKFLEKKELILAKEYSQVYDSLIQLLEGLENSLGDEKIKLDDFEHLAQSGIEQLRIGIIPPGIDDVMVGDIERTRLKDIKKVMFLIGANDGIIPEVTAPATIINDTDRERLKQLNVELAPTTKDNVFKQMFYLYTLINKPTEKFIVSYSNNDKDSKPIKKSYFVKMLDDLLSKTDIMKTIAREDTIDDIINKNVSYDYLAEQGAKRRNGKQSKDEILLYNAIEAVLKEEKDTKYVYDIVRKGTFFKFKDGVLSKTVANDIFDDAQNAKITRIQKYIECPYKHFGIYGLKLSERKKYELSAMEIGNVEHRILEKLFGGILRDGLNVRDLDEKDLYSRLDKSIEDEFESDELSDYFSNDPARNFSKSQLAKMAKETVDILVKHIKESNFDVFKVESSNTGGKADRVDKYIDGENVFLKVIDYKTGKKSFDFGTLMSGLDMQVFVYLKSVIEDEKNNPNNSGKSIIPAGAFYFRVHNPYLVQKMGEDENDADENLEKERIKNYKLTGLINDACKKSIGGNRAIGDIMVSASSNSLERNYYEKLLDYTDKKMTEAKDSMQDGSIAIEPYEDACKYCGFKGLCRFEMSKKDYKEVEKLDAEKVKEILDKED